LETGRVFNKVLMSHSRRGKFKVFGQGPSRKARMWLKGGEWYGAIHTPGERGMCPCLMNVLAGTGTLKGKEIRLGGAGGSEKQRSWGACSSKLHSAGTRGE